MADALKDIHPQTDVAASDIVSSGRFGVWSPIETAPTRKTIHDPNPRLLLLCKSGRIEIGWHDSDQYAKRVRPFWHLEGRWSRTLAMRADQPTHWMPLPPNAGGVPRPESAPTPKHSTHKSL